MLNQFSRSELLLGKEAIDKLKNSKVIVFGVGGVGGYAIEALVRTGLGSIDLVDNDVVSLTNINRQIIATTDTIGRQKTEVMYERIKAITPECKVQIYNQFYLPENRDMFDFTKYDYIIDAIDTVSAKIDLVLKANEAGTKIISAMGAGNKLNPCGFEVSDIYKTSICPLAKVMRKELRQRGVKSLKVVYSKEEPKKPDILTIEEYKENLKDTDTAENKPSKKRSLPGSVAFVPPVVGLIIASEVIKDLANF